jgi:exosortase D (VPLPA-CTERM-specific)
VGLIGIIFRRSIADLATTWLTSPEYNYGPIVPFIAALMFWRDLQATEAPRKGGWSGVALASLGLVAGIVGFRTQTQFIGQLGLFLTVIGACIAIVGEARALRAWPGLLFLLFALPLATVIQFDLTWALQLVATEGGVALIRLFGVSVFREGNVIDLGQFQLQVAEACSGLRYLFPLASFSFLCAYFFRSGPIIRTLVFVSALPITVLMNIVRIAVTGFLVNWLGIEAAQGFFHDFEGWAVFCLCIVVLMLEMKLFCLFSRSDRGLLRRMEITLPQFRLLLASRGIGVPRPVLAVAALCLLALAMEFVVSARGASELARTEFNAFPAVLGEWKAEDAPIDQESLTKLDATDYLSRNYFASGQPPVNFFVSYYASQKSGTAIHSPQVCIPGGGWEIEQIGDIRSPFSTPGRLTPEYIKRLLIRRGAERQLVYYWFEIGGEASINEYSSKVRMFINALTESRTDGGLVRFVTPIASVAGVEKAEQRLSGFLQYAGPLLSEYMPQ